MISKSLESALAAMALLAEVYETAQPALTADQIAENRKLNKPFLAKLLTALVQGGLVSSKPGRNGGFSLARPPEAIRLADVAQCIGYRTRLKCCPFGPQYGDGRGHCTLHERVCELRDTINAFLEENTLRTFAKGC